MSSPVHLVCAHCDAIVRVPSDRLGQHPKCAKCHRELFEGHPIELRSAMLALWRNGRRSRRK